MSKRLQKIKIVIFVFSILLALSLASLAGILLFGRAELSVDSDSVTDNYIKPTVNANGTITTKSQCLASPVMLSTPLLTADLSRGVPLTASQKTVIESDSTKDTVIRIYKRHAQDSTPFRLFNMFPGDSHTRSYFVEVSHKGTVTVRFRANILQGSEKLAEVLKCKIVIRGENKPLFDGLMRDMPSSLKHRVSALFNKTTELVYDVTVYLDTSVGNEYMDKALAADFCWWVCDSGSDPYPPSTDPLDTNTADPDDSTSSDVTADPTDTTDSDPDDGELVSPETGVNVHFCIWFWIAMISIFINFILLRPGRCAKNGEQEDKTTNDK